MGQGLPARELWNKVHPDREMSGHLDRLSTIRDRPRVDVVRLIEVIEKQQTRVWRSAARLRLCMAGGNFEVSCQS